MYSSDKKHEKAQWCRSELSAVFPCCRPFILSFYAVFFSHTDNLPHPLSVSLHPQHTQVNQRHNNIASKPKYSLIAPAFADLDIFFDRIIGGIYKNYNLCASLTHCCNSNVPKLKYIVFPLQPASLECHVIGVIHFQRK